MAVAKPIHRLTEAEYLEIERRAEFKSEFLDGEMFAMSGGSDWHSQIAANLIRAVGNQLQGRPCATFTSDLRIKVQAIGLYTYPDMSVVCGERKFEDGRRDILLNPVVIAEVLSDSSEAYDRGKKFEFYRQISSLQEYLMVSQRRPLIEQFIRQDSGEWLLREVAGMDARLSSPSLNITIALSEIFAQVEFLPSEIRVESSKKLR